MELDIIIEKTFKKIKVHEQNAPHINKVYI